MDYGQAEAPVKKFKIHLLHSKTKSDSRKQKTTWATKGSSNHLRSSHTRLKIRDRKSLSQLQATKHYSSSNLYEKCLPDVQEPSSEPQFEVVPIRAAHLYAKVN